MLTANNPTLVGVPTVLETCCLATSYLVGSGNVAGCVTYVLGACGPSYVLVVDLGLACSCSGGFKELITFQPADKVNAVVKYSPGVFCLYSSKALDVDPI